MFQTEFSLFKYLAMPFSLMYAPAMFQAFIDKALGEFLDITCVIYLNNILIFSKDESKHSEHVQQVLAALQHYDLYLKISKCSFNATEVDFLEFKINMKDIYIDLERIQALEEWLPLENVHELQVFLDFANFFQRFIRDYLQIAALLLNLLKTGRNKKKTGVVLAPISSQQTALHQDIEGKQSSSTPLQRSSTGYSACSSQVRGELQQENIIPAPFPLSEAALKAFNALKETFTSASLLHYFDENKLMRVEMDASKFIIGGILMQCFEVDS